MTRKLSQTRASQTSKQADKSRASVSEKMIEAHAFDEFIAEKLKQERSPDDQSSDGIVCHVY